MKWSRLQATLKTQSSNLYLWRIEVPGGYDWPAKIITQIRTVNPFGVVVRREKKKAANRSNG